MGDVDGGTLVKVAQRTESQAILKAFRFLEGVTIQIEALRSTLMEQLKSSGELEKIGLRTDQIDDGWNDIQSSWLTRSSIDTFAVFRKGRGRKLLFHCGFQISLAPSKARADEEFFPHLAVLLGRADESDPWKCEEFELDDIHLREVDEDDPWVTSGEGRWVSRIYPFSAFTIPLVDLKDECDVKTLVMERMCREIVDLQRWTKVIATGETVVVNT